MLLCLDVKPLNALSLHTFLLSLSPKAHQVDGNRCVLFDTAPARLEEGRAFLQPLDPFTRSTLFCTRLQTIHSLQPWPLALGSAQDFGGLKNGQCFLTEKGDPSVLIATALVQIPIIFHPEPSAK